MTEDGPDIIAEYRKREQALARRGKPAISVGTELSDPHRWVVATRRCLEKAKPSADGLLRPKAIRRLDLRVSPANLMRGLLIFDALLKALEGRGINVRLASEGKCRTVAVVGGEEVRIQLMERTIRVPHVLTAADKERMQLSRNFHGVPKFDYKPTGTLSLRVGDGSTPRRREDEGPRRLEAQLDGVIKAIVREAQAQRDRRDREARLSKESREAALRREAKRRRHQKKLKRIGQLDRLVSQWESARTIRAFVPDVRAVAARRKTPIPEESPLTEWLGWALRRADQLDPIPGLLAGDPQAGRLPRDLEPERRHLARLIEGIAGQLRITGGAFTGRGYWRS